MIYEALVLAGGGDVSGAKRSENGHHNDYRVRSKLAGLRFLPILERGICPLYPPVTYLKYQCFVGKTVFPLPLHCIFVQSDRV